jgi:hypothetical protein
MQFMIMMASDEDVWNNLSDAEQSRIVGDHERVTAELEAQHKFVCSFRLADSAHARTVVRSPDGELSVTDGPFAESKECLGGIYVIEAESMAEAVEWGRKLRFIPGANEVRPLYA